jgi:glycosyltransferase involved in cell wall biosynthesis
MATHNHARYLREALGSVVGQTSFDWELVVVDDGSTDNTQEVLSAWQAEVGARLPQRVTLLRTENDGQSAACEAGYAHCRGRYVALLDSDDRWLPAKLERVTDILVPHPELTLLTHSQFVITADGVRTGKLWPRGGILASGDLRNQIRHSARLAVGTASSLVIRADVFAALLPVPTRRFPSAADYYFAFGACLAGPIAAVPEPLGEYRIHPDSMYLNRMSGSDGLRRQLELQETIAGHFGLLAVLPRNAYYQRARYALACLGGSPSARARAYGALASAIVRDPYFGAAQKAQQVVFWGLGALLPKAGFARLWRWFLLR